VPVGTVMSRLHRGRRLLAEALAGERDRVEATAEAA
jgi:DNA-directed RNA polymerase specialized sigma24 family protein